MSFVPFVVKSAAQPAPDPEIERRSFQVADGFEVSLFAADPMLAKPIQMNFDPAGRLWVATSEIYPQIKPGQVADDKILVLEDVDGDGKAEKATVFARGLLIPTGVLPGDGGVYVANSTEIVHLKDTDGDGKADASRVVLSGFGTEDTHHIIHTFRWGMDGNFYFNQSIYIHSHVETPWGPRRLLAGGTWAFRPDTMELGVFTRGLINHWGHCWSKYGDSFLTDGAGGEGVNYAFPGVRYTASQPAFPGDTITRQLRGLNPGSPKFASAEVISGRHFPDDWQGDVITNDFRANRVARFKLSEDGAGFSSKLMPDVIKSSDRAFRPIDVKMGPDGALYIADWYNPIINHGEVDFRDPRRDKTHGRIWRVTAKGRDVLKRPKLAGASVEELLEQLKSPEDYTRRQARLVLRETNKAQVLLALDKWVAGLGEDDDFARLQALWTYQTMDIVSAGLLNKLLHCKDAGIRAAACRVVGVWGNKIVPPAGAPPVPGQTSEPTMATTLAWVRDALNDAHPRVRLEAVRAAATVQDARAMEMAMGVLDLPMDQFLDYALYLTANELQNAWLPAFQEGRLTFGHNAKKIEFALKAIRNPAAIKPLVEDFAAGKIAAGSRKDVGELIASLGGADEAKMLFGVATATETDAGTRAALVGSLERAARGRGVRPAYDAERLKALAGDADVGVAAAGARLIGAVKVAALKGDVLAIAESADRPVAVRRAAIESLADLGDVKALSALAGKAEPKSLRGAAVAALAGVDAKTAAPLAAELLAGKGEGADWTAVLGAFLKRKDGPAVLGAALKEESPTVDNAKLALRAVYALGHSEAVLVDPLKAAAKIDAAPKPLTPAEMTQLIADVQSKGDAARGEAVFRRADTACMRCHSIAGAGGTLAPDISSLGAAAPVDYLIDSILLPNKAIKENYHASIVETTDGDQIIGIKVRQTDKELVLRDAMQDEIVIPLNTIKGKPREAGSMMPAGLADPLTRQELVDLVRFLSELGRPGAYAVGPQQLARRWQVLEPAPAGVVGGAALSLGGAANWMPGYSQVSGTLPLGDSGTTLARAQVAVTTPGVVKLMVTGAKGVWVDDKPVAGTEISVDLSRGAHWVTVLGGPGGSLRLELAEAAGSSAKAQFVGGR